MLFPEVHQQHVLNYDTYSCACSSSPLTNNKLQSFYAKFTCTCITNANFLYSIRAQCVSANGIKIGIFSDFSDVDKSRFYSQNKQTFCMYIA